jgi:hypothetical protein
MMHFKLFGGHFGVAVLFAASLPLNAGTFVYNDLPISIPQSSPSLGFQANHTSEFGDLIQPASGPAILTSGGILMDDHALESDYAGVGTDSGWSLPITLNLYNVDSSSGTPQPGSEIYTTTESFNIPWEPVGQAGQDFLITFSLPDIAVPSQFIYSVVYNTETFGPDPFGVSGPYISLNVAVNTTAPPQVGTRPNPDSGYLNANACAYYFDSCAGGGSAGVFRQDTGYTPYSLAGEFTADTSTPEPSTFALLCCGGILGGLVVVRTRWARNAASQPKAG